MKRALGACYSIPRAQHQQGGRQRVSVQTGKAREPVTFRPFSGHDVVHIRYTDLQVFL